RTIDVNEVSVRLDELAALLAQAPLLVPDRVASDRVAPDRVAPDRVAPDRGAPEPGAPVASAPAGGVAAADPAAVELPWWQEAWRQAGDWSRSAWDAVREDAGRFIAVRRVDDESALLLSPEQADRLRDQLRLRLMTARLALLMRQPAVWETEMS